MSNEIMLQKKPENTCQSTRTSGLSSEPNSYIVYSHKDILAPLQTYFSSKTDYNISAPRKAFKSLYLTFKPQFRDVSDLTHFLQLGKFEMPRALSPTNTQSCCGCGTHPSTLPAIRSSTPLYGQRRILTTCTLLSLIPGQQTRIFQLHRETATSERKNTELSNITQQLLNQMKYFPLLQRS